MKKRIEYIDIMKAIGMILVIIGHINNFNQDIKPYIYAFHMPLFFFIYGFTKNEGNKKEVHFKDIFKKRFRTLIIPYFLWAFLYVGISIKNILYIAFGSHISLKKIDGNSSLWYLPAFFLSVIIFESIYYCLNIKKIEEKKCTYVYIITMIVCIIISTILPNFSIGYLWGINVSFMGTAFMIIGFYHKKIIDKIRLIEKNKCFLFVSTLLCFLGTFLYKFNNIDYVLMAENIYGNVLLFIISAITGIWFILTFSILIDKMLKERIKKKLIFFGENTLCMFAMQKLPINFFMNISNYSNMNRIFGVTIVTILTLIILSLGIRFINEFVPELNGKTKN